MKSQYKTNVIQVSHNQQTAKCHASMKPWGRPDGNSNMWQVRCYVDGAEVGNKILINTMTHSGPIIAATAWVKKCLAQHFRVGSNNLTIQGTIKWT